MVVRPEPPMQLLVGPLVEQVEVERAERFVEHERAGIFMQEEPR